MIVSLTILGLTNDACGYAVQNTADLRRHIMGNEVVVKQRSGAWYTSCRSFLVYDVFRETVHNLAKESVYG